VKSWNPNKAEISLVDVERASVASVLQAAAPDLPAIVVAECLDPEADTPSLPLTYFLLLEALVEQYSAKRAEQGSYFDATPPRPTSLPPALMDLPPDAPRGSVFGRGAVEECD